jgi:glycerol uptake facilitator-like aquaporin
MIDSTALLAEFLGTFLLVMAVLATSGNALVDGGALAIIIFLIGKTSGGHVNPAISTAMYMKGSLTFNEFMGYVAAQVIGGVASLSAYKVFA